MYGDVYGVSNDAIFAEGTTTVDREIGDAESHGGQEEPIEISEPLTPEESTLGYIFTPLDDQICRD